MGSLVLEVPQPRLDRVWLAKEILLVHLIIDGLHIICQFQDGVTIVSILTMRYNGRSLSTAGICLTGAATAILDRRKPGIRTAVVQVFEDSSLSNVNSSRQYVSLPLAPLYSVS